MAAYLDVVKAIDPRISTETKDAIVAQVVPQSVRRLGFSSASASSTPQFSVYPPGSVNMAMDRNVVLHCAGTLTYTGANLDASQVCLRPWPLHSMMSNATVTLNGQTFSTPNVSTIIPALSMVANPATTIAGVQSSTCTAPDTVLNLIQAIDGAASPFRIAADAPSGGYVPPSRKRNITNIAVNEAKTQLAVTFDIYEPLQVSPLAISGEPQRGFIGLQNMTIQLAFTRPELLCSLILKADAAITNASFAWTTQEVRVTFYELTTIERPFSRAAYSYGQMQMYQSQAVAINGDQASYQFSIQTAALGQVPRQILVWIQPNVTGQRVNMLEQAKAANAFLPISNLRLAYYSGSSVLADASQRDLWEMSIQNGLSCDYARFIGQPILAAGAVAANRAAGILGYFGSAPVVLSNGDLGLPGGATAGSKLATSVTLTGTFNNPAIAIPDGANQPAIISATAFMLVVSDGVLTLDRDGSAQSELVGLTQADVVDAPTISMGEAAKVNESTSSSGVAGGSFFNDFLDGLEKVGKTGLSLAPAALSLFGAGEVGGSALGGSALGGSALGGRARGGAIMTRASLKDRLG